jgi:hypothetical protein
MIRWVIKFLLFVLLNCALDLFGQSGLYYQYEDAFEETQPTEIISSVKGPVETIHKTAYEVNVKPTGDTVMFSYYDTYLEYDFYGDCNWSVKFDSLGRKRSIRRYYDRLNPYIFDTFTYTSSYFDLNVTDSTVIQNGGYYTQYWNGKSVLVLGMNLDGGNYYEQKKFDSLGRISEINEQRYQAKCTTKFDYSVPYYVFITEVCDDSLLNCIETLHYDFGPHETNYNYLNEITKNKDMRL